ncbi:hypothetical protein [Phaeocystidibacter luteus]|uniref:FkbM family methyltransferase n=1 Tax=Phaeocystidibacter luteus TaxID=911197 RepID=A0A6N6RF43_9FLAO|nr:hypothetical protein [Phaeocystidibacter luteus]KAB2809776.1 hypothetical protein F8C67_09475 [Phaeocystidibacter luteus]
MKARIQRWKKLIQQVKGIEKEREMRSIASENFLKERFETLLPTQTFKEVFASNELKVYSQNGEDGLLLYLLQQVGIHNRTMIEFGIGDGRQCNSANLILNFGFKTLLLEGNPNFVKSAKRYYHDLRFVEKNRLTIKEAFITRDNINGLFAEAGFEGEIDILSIDIDGNDYWIWKAINVVNPRIVVMEYNASVGPDESLTVAYDPSFSRMEKHPSGWYHGASLQALTKLGSELGYELVGCDSCGVNAFFVRKDLVGNDLQIQKPEDAYYHERKRTKRMPTEEQFKLVSNLDWQKV